ncbi:hypothetical protein, partial [Pseudomonas sp. L13]|uniref:hypothetical protein n=1 Tax=Pseudomonas sp. L13 TaxID=343985 RepID=UPI001C4987A3
MSSINGSVPSIPTYQPTGKHPIDHDVPRKNPLDKQAGEDAEVSNDKGGWKTIGNATRDHANRIRLDRNFLPSDEKNVDASAVSTNSRPIASDFLPTNTIDDRWVSANRDFDTKPIGSPDQPKAGAVQEPIDVEIRSDGNGGWVQAGGNQEPIDHEIQSDGNGGWIQAGGNQEPIDHEIQSDGNGGWVQAGGNQEPIDVEIRSDGNGGWVQAGGNQEPIDHEIQSDGNGGWVQAGGNQEPIDHEIQSDG